MVKATTDNWTWEIGVVDGQYTTSGGVCWQNDFVQAATQKEAEDKAAAKGYYRNVIVRAVKVPYRCPVCEGRGRVPVGFYNPLLQDGNQPTFQDCRSCRGSGVIWG
jgi:hypothetical protein